MLKQIAAGHAKVYGQGAVTEADHGVSHSEQRRNNAVKINDTLKGNTPLPAANAPAAGAKNADKASTAAPASTGDSVRLSSQGQAMAAAVGSSNAVFDTKKVERIKLAIADGQFNVNSEKVADGLLETVRDLLHSRKR